MVSVVAVLACHNRRELTVRCLGSLFGPKINGLDLSAVLVDDGSSDGTAEAVADLGRAVTVVTGPGDWYWSRSMAEAERVAEESDPDWILWLNDDVVVRPEALLRWMLVARRHRDAILVGAMWSPVLKRVAYGGFDWPDRRSLARTRLQQSGAEPTAVAGFHGNFVVVPRAARRSIGPIDGTWPHYYADLDYALRAERRGVEILLMPGIAGECDPVTPAWQDSSLPRRDRLRSALGTKGWPITAHWRLHRRHGQRGWWRHAWAPHWSALTGPDRGPGPGGQDAAGATCGT